MPDESWELAPPTEMEHDVLAFTQQYEDDLGLVVEAEVIYDGGPEQVIVTTCVIPIDGVEEYQRPAVRHTDVDEWKRWVEKEFAPAWYV